jgi:RNA polymerase sigma factor (sigma-70 family)
VNQDAELLRRFVQERSEPAFADLVQRNANLVYSSALRLVRGDAHRAQDVTQQVFAEAARQAKRLVNHPALVGWLYTTTRQMALRVVRTEQRRKTREREATMMNVISNGPELEWDRLAPMLDEAMHELGEKDRVAVLMRFFQQKGLREVGLALGLNENAARMRVERALEKLRTHLARKGVASTAALLGSTLASHGVIAAPPAFVTSLAGVSLAAGAAAGGSLTILEIMAMSKLKISIIGALVAVSVTTPLVIHHQSEMKLRGQEKTLQQQQEQLAKLAVENERLSGLLAQPKTASTLRLPAPVLKATRGQPDIDLSVTNLYAKLNGEQPKLASERVESYVKANHRNAPSLLAAYRTTGAAAWLEEAMQKYPDEPQVAFEAAFKKDGTPEDRRHWLDAF